MGQLITSVALSAIINVVLFAGIPFLGYFVYQKWRNKRSFREITQRAGLRVGKWRYIAYSAGVACVIVVVLSVWPPFLSSLVRAGSAQHIFVGQGLTAPAIVAALIYGVVQTGFTEELLFRGLITGSLSRRLPSIWANIIQAVLFLFPHLLLLKVMPTAWPLLFVVFVFGLLCGRLRIKSGSIFGPWMIHASANATVALIVAVHTAP